MTDSAKEEVPKQELAPIANAHLISGDDIKVAPDPRRKFFIFVNGIETKADRSRNIAGWHFAAARYIDLHTSCPSDTYPYEVGTFTRYRMQGRVVRNFAKCISDIDPALFRLILVGHSNGAQVICQALCQHPEILKVAEVHLIAGACDRSFAKNGLNELILDGRVNYVLVYYDRHDPVLKWARRTEWIPFLRYGSLGLEGPTNKDEQLPAQRVIEMEFPHWGHGEYFAPGHFEEIMKRIIGGPDAMVST